MFCGSREWTDVEMIRRDVGALPDDTTVIHGACRGADTIAGKLALERGLNVIPYPAKWKLYGKKAGWLRNQEMVNSGIDEVYAYCKGEAKGTRMAVSLAEVRNITVHRRKEVES